MTNQLRLIDPAEVSWRLDEHTKALGRHGIARARAVLATARSSTTTHVMAAPALKDQAA